MMKQYKIRKKFDANLVEFTNIYNKRIKRKPKTGTKEFFVHDYLVFGTRGYSVLRTQNMNMIST